MTEKTVREINKILDKDEHNYAAGFYTCLVMDPLISGTFGATKALLECEKISPEYEDELLNGYKGSSLRLFDIFNCDNALLETYMSIQHADEKFADYKVPFSGATGYVIILNACGVISDDECAFLITEIAMTILENDSEKSSGKGGDMFEYDDE